MRKNEAKQRLTAIVLSVILVVGMIPVSVLAETGTFPIGTSGEITVFETLGADIAMRSVPLGTSEADLKLPNTLTAMVRLMTLEEESVLDSGEVGSDGVNAVSGSAIDINGINDTQTGKEVEIAAPLPVTWTSSPEYDGEATGTYVFKPNLPEGLTLRDDAEIPKIIVTVDAAITGTADAFEELPDNIRWQNTTTPKFPEKVGAAVKGKAVQIPVTWEADHHYDAEYPQRGLYVFTAILGEGYKVADGVELPHMTVYIPQTVGGIRARMSGGGTTDSPLEITTAVQLAEIATLVNARENGLELFLFNDANAEVSLKLMNDIDLSAYSKGEGWIPIGTSIGRFSGVFDGGGNNIRGLYINRNADYQGLFGFIVSSGTVKNLGVVNASIIGSKYVGSVAGAVLAGGTVASCYSTGAISGTIGVGGVVGYVNGTMKNCYSAGSVSGTDHVGGVVGAIPGGMVQNCYSTSAISGTSVIGGVAGEVFDSGMVQNCAALNLLVSGTSKVGRVAGQIDSSNLSGNIAFAGMTLTQGGSEKTPVEGVGEVDGESKTAADIKTAGFFEVLFDNDTAWIYAEDRLPVLAGSSGQSDALPAYITGLAGAGTSADPYRIYTAEDLKWMADQVNGGTSFAYGKFFRLENNIDLSVYGKDYEGGRGWTPIGTFVNAVFDGNFKTITGLYINRSNENIIGLFGQVTAGTIRNLFLEGIALNNNTDYSEGKIGGLAGQVSGGSTISGCAATGFVMGEGKSISYCAGGLVGFLEQGSTLNNCAFYGTVSAKAKEVSEPPTSPPNIFAGGITGRIYNGAAVTNCISVADVSATVGNAYAGGIAGQVDAGAKIALSAALGAGVIADTAAGRITGIITSTASGDPNNINYAWSGMEANGSMVSGTANDSNGEDTDTVTIKTLWTSGALKGWDSTAWTLAQDKLPVLKGLSDQSHALPAYLTEFAGVGTNDDPYRIYTADDLKWLSDQVNSGISYSGKFFRLENDLDLSAYGADYDGGKGWMPIGTFDQPFKGIFDGGGKTITGLYIDRNEQSYVGLFGSVISGTVKDLVLRNVSVDGMSSVGGVAGSIYDGGMVQSCTVSGTIRGNSYVGGMVGFVVAGMVENCYSTGSLTGTGSYIGGMVGRNNSGTIKNCVVATSVSGVSDVGGVVGFANTCKVENCYSTGSITGQYVVGGVAGYAYDSILKNSVALSPSVSGNTHLGRVVGNFTSGTFLSNYAFSRIPGTWVNEGSSAKDGADVSSQTLFGGNFWTAEENWDGSSWDSSIWTFEGGKLPTLTGLAGQSGESGLYLTTRDIQYATVGTVGPLTYNGSKQIPTITFDGETLTIGTDYTVSITSTDGSDTSAGTNAGTVTLTITGIGSFFGTKNLTYNIEKMPVTITPNSLQGKIYGSEDPTLLFGNDGHLAPGDFNGALSRAVGENVGTYAISLGDLSAGGNYELSLASGTFYFTISQAKVVGIADVQDVTMSAYEARSATTAQAVVDLADLPSNVSVSTHGGKATLPITWETSTKYNARGAEYAVTGTLTGNSNVDTNGVTKSVTIAVTPVIALTPIFDDTLAVINSDSSATADELGGTILPTSGDITISGVKVAYTISWNGGETLDRTTVGNKQTFTGTIRYSSPPAWITLPSDLTVSRKVTVTDKTLVTIGGIATANKTYDSTSYVPDGTIICSHGFPINQLEWLYESTDGAGYSSSIAPTNAGAYKLTISVPEGNANYAGSKMNNFTIEKRQITLAADNKTVIRGASLPQLTYSVNNLPTGKTKADALSIEPALACPTFDGNTPGTYTIILTDGTATDNYTITDRIGGNLTVAEQTYTVTFNLNGGSHTGGGELTQKIAEGGAAMAPTVTRSGYSFTGWDKVFTHVTSNLTVTAGWSYNGGGSSYTPGNPTTTTPEKEPDQPVMVATPVTARVGAGGSANAAIPDKAIIDSIKKAQADAKAQGKTVNGISMALNITMPKDSTSLNVTLTRNSLNSLVSAGVSQLKLIGAPISLSLDLKSLQEIQKQNGGDTSITIAPATGLSKEAKGLLGDRPVYSITISYVKDGKTVNITSLGSGTATLSIPYTPGKKEAYGYLFGVYVDAKGKAQRIFGSVYDVNSRSLLIPTDHFSVYGVGYTVPSAKFTDIGNHWGKEAIDYVVGRGLLSSTSKTTFSPDTTMTRGMLVTALGKLAGVDAKVYTKNSFTDVKAKSSFRPYIEWAYSKSIIQGVSNLLFAPDNPITREEIAVVFANYAKATGYKLPVTRNAAAYADASSIGSVYKIAVTAMQQAGIMMGGLDNKLNPKASVTRAEFSAMLHRYIKLTIDPDTAQGWTLNDAGQWFYYKDGKILTGMQIISDAKYFFNTEGTLKIGWVKDGSNWRHYSGNQATVGWIDISDKQYYFTTDGLMVSGKWLKIGGKWYYFYADGSLAKNTIIDGYWVDDSGIGKTK